MVITDFESGTASREASGRFQVTPEYRLTPRLSPTLTAASVLPIQVELQYARDRIRAHIASRQIDVKHGRN